MFIVETVDELGENGKDAANQSKNKVRRDTGIAEVEKMNIVGQNTDNATFEKDLDKTDGENKEIDSS